MVNAVIFDMDGVLIDTEKYLFRFWKQAMKEAGYEISHEQLLGIRSLAAEFAIPRFRELFGTQLDYISVRDRRKELMNGWIAEHGIEKKTGVDAILDYLERKGCKRAVATATDMDRAARYLREIGILERFDQVVCAPLVPHGKPMPDVYLYACAQIGEEPKNCVALEDSDNGALAAYRAGCQVVFVKDLADPLPETEAFLAGKAENLKEAVAVLKTMGV